MLSDEIRASFLKYFQEKSHLVVPSSSLIPYNDPTLLFTSAGMVQFKPYFLGLSTPSNLRMASCQKCFRTTDIDSVGDSKHLTFFEMLGNFSIGDYFKKEAITRAWEYVTEFLKLPKERLWITVYENDEEALNYWLALGIPLNKVVKGGDKDNFWGPAGDIGPCGPCSEIHYDFGENYGCGRPTCGPLCNCERFLEIWNLVFTQLEQLKDGTRIPLPRPNIDTGMGLERVTAVLQGSSTVYETDLFMPLIDLCSQITGISYKKEVDSGHKIRVIVEHSRGITFLIGDGVVPSNEGRGYVLRRLTRRAILFGRRLGIARPFLSEISLGVINLMSTTYPELKEQKDFILKVVQGEESRFQQTLDNGLILLEGAMKEAEAGDVKALTGKQAFQLYDTYGFPVELTREILAEKGFNLDEKDFQEEMEAQRQRSRSTQKFAVQTVEKEGLESLATTFSGYETLSANTIVLRIFKSGKIIENAEEGEEVEVVLRETPFYGEMGGQVGDQGEIKGPAGKMEVTDAAKPISEVTLHKGKIVRGTLREGDTVEVTVEEGRRLDIARNHTATHLLQAALRSILGKHIQQKGSLVAPDRLRFDFTHLSPMTDKEKRKVEQEVNRYSRQNLPVKSDIVSYSEAIKRGALAFFGEKYGERVRIMQIGEPPISQELCGGTHLHFTGQIGILVITSESSIGAGLRRIEAITGRGAEMLVQSYTDTMQKIAGQLGCIPEKVSQTMSSVLKEREEAQKYASRLERELIQLYVKDIAKRAEKVNGITLIAAPVEAKSIQGMREAGDFLKNSFPSSIIVLGSVIEGRPAFLSMVTPDLVKQGFHAGNIVKQVASIAGGGGGGRPEMAQAGGKDPAKLEEAIRRVREIVAKK